MKDIKLLKSSFLNSYLSVMEYLMFISNSSDDYRIIVTKDTLNNYLDGINIIIEKNYFKGENNCICYKNGIVLASDDASELIDTIRNDFKDKDSAIIFSASLLKSEGKDGNAYALQFSFDPNDIPKDSKITDITDEESFEYINNAMNTNKHNAFNFNVQSGGAYNMFSVIRGIVVTLKEFGRDALVNSSDDHNIEFKGYFILTASVSDDGKVTLKFTPSELLKQIIKEDSGIEDKDKKVDEKPVAFVA